MLAQGAVKETSQSFHMFSIVFLDRKKEGLAGISTITVSKAAKLGWVFANPLINPGTCYVRRDTPFLKVEMIGDADNNVNRQTWRGSLPTFVKQIRDDPAIKAMGERHGLNRIVVRFAIQSPVLSSD